MSIKPAKRLASLFEKAASDTWERLEASKELGISQNVYEKSISLSSNILITNSELQHLIDRCYLAKSDIALASWD